MNNEEKLKILKEESKKIISDIRGAPDYDFKGKEYDKRIISLRRKTLYLYKKITKDKGRKFKSIERIFEAIEKKLTSKSAIKPLKEKTNE